MSDVFQTGGTQDPVKREHDGPPLASPTETPKPGQAEGDNGKHASAPHSAISATSGWILVDDGTAVLPRFDTAPIVSAPFVGSLAASRTEEPFQLKLEPSHPKLQDFLDTVFAEETNPKTSAVTAALDRYELQPHVAQVGDSLFLSVKALRILMSSFQSFARSQDWQGFDSDETRKTFKDTIGRGGRYYLAELSPEESRTANDQQLLEKSSGKFGYLIPLDRPELLNETFTHQSGVAIPCADVIHPSDRRLRKIVGYSPADPKDKLKDILASTRVASGDGRDPRDVKITRGAFSALLEEVREDLKILSVVQDATGVVKPDAVDTLRALATMLRNSKRVTRDEVRRMMPTKTELPSERVYEEYRGTLLEFAPDRQTLTNVIHRRRPLLDPHADKPLEGSPQAAWMEQNPFLFSLIRETLRGGYGQKTRSLLTRVDDGLFLRRADFRRFAGFYRDHRMRCKDGDIRDRKEVRQDILRVCGGREVNLDPGGSKVFGGFIIPWQSTEIENLVLRRREGKTFEVPFRFHPKDIVFQEVDGLETLTLDEKNSTHRDCVAKIEGPGRTYYLTGPALRMYMEDGTSCVSRRGGLARLCQHFLAARFVRPIGSTSEWARLGMAQSNGAWFENHRWGFVVSNTEGGHTILACKRKHEWKSERL